MAPTGMCIKLCGGDMRKLLMGAAILFLLPLCAWAQQEFSRVEVFGGYSFLHDLGTYNGWNASVTRNFSPWFGIKGELGGYYRGLTSEVSYNSYSFLFGPNFSYRTSRATTFAHFLMGVNRTATDDDGDYTHTSAAKFAFAIGGGIDINIKKNLDIRPCQLDYYYLRKEAYQYRTIISDHRNDLRFSAGIVFKFGTR
jgi:opacity protein-like surface antigen